MPHIHEKIDYAADTYIVNGNTVLLRMHDKSGAWFPPGGHIELDEDPEEAAIREVKEEVGLQVELIGDRLPDLDDAERELISPRYVNRHRINDTHEHVSFIYFARSDSREIRPGPGEKEVEMRWFTKEELRDPQFGVRPRIVRYALAALDTLGA